MTEHPAKSWRLIDTGSLPGPVNMAIDEALLRFFDPTTSSPILRLYGWSPPALSLGRFQNAAQVLNLERCQEDGVAVVRRITGGGVIYHADELTYSIVCAPGQIPPAVSVKDSFRVLTGFLLAFYCRLGLNAAYALDAAPKGARLGERTAFCFAGKESFDILANGCKIGGNAQRRMKGLIFQHGSIPLVNRAHTGLGYMREQEAELAHGATALADCGIAAGPGSLRQDLISAFSDCFTVKLCEDQLSAQEQACAEQLSRMKYASDTWNLEGVGE